MELELQVLGIEPKSSGRAGCVLNGSMNNKNPETGIGVQSEDHKSKAVYH